MVLETSGGTAVAEATSGSTGAEETSSPAVTTSESSASSYSVTDPGYDGDLFDDYEAETASESQETPSETLDDASETESGNTEEVAEKPTEDAVDETTISDELLDRAVELGYTLDEIRGFQSAKSLEKEISRVERLNQRLQERQAGKKPAETETAPVEAAKPEPDWAALIELGHDPDMIALQKESWKEAQDAKALVQQLLQTERNRVFEAQCQRFDETLNNLGEEYKSLLGNGTRAELAKSSPEHVGNRQQVFTMMNMLREGYERSGMPVPPESELIQQAVHTSFFKQTQEMARTRLKNDIKKAGSQGLSRPKSSGAKPLAGPDLALQKELEWRKKFE
jgi:hypothetical protein